MGSDVTVEPQRLAAKIRVLVHNGKLDEDIDEVLEFLRARKQYLSDKAASALRPGDRVVIRNIKPRYLNGMVGHVRGRMAGKIEVELDQQPRGDRFGKVLIFPASCVEALK